MERLWAPWRGSYVTGSGAAQGCFLCAAADRATDALVVAREDDTITLLNRFPYNPGHLLVAPRQHASDLIAAGDATAAALMVGARRAMRALSAAMHPDGFNVGVNHGETAGASIVHVHVHVVPRWDGDTNFMPVVGETKVLPETLEESAGKLRAAFAALDDS